MPSSTQPLTLLLQREKSPTLIPDTYYVSGIIIIMPASLSEVAPLVTATLRISYGMPENFDSAVVPQGVVLVLVWSPPQTNLLCNELLMSKYSLQSWYIIIEFLFCSSYSSIKLQDLDAKTGPVCGHNN